MRTVFSAGLGMSLTAMAATGPATDLVPLEDFARAPIVQTVRASPDGGRLALVETIDGRGAIVVTDADGGERRVLYRDPARSVDNVAWSGDGRWLWFLHDAGGDEGYHLYRVDTNARDARATDLTPFPRVSVSPVSTPRAIGGHLVVTNNRRDPAWPDAFDVDLATGKLTELDRNEHGVTEYFADGAGVLRSATAIAADGSVTLLAAGPGHAWHRVYTAPADERFKVLSLTYDGRGAVARTNRSRPAEELVRVDLATGRVDPLAPHACGRFDVEDVALDADGVAMIACTTERAGLVARHPSDLRALVAIRRIVGTDTGLEIANREASSGMLLVYADASDRSGRYVLYTPGRGARPVAETRPWLKARKLAVAVPHWVKARDGLMLLTYVTRPVGSRGPGPVVIALHGGPWSRDTGGFEATNQLLASRGYTVVQVNFRGSTGLGRATFDGGVGEFGGRMSDDVDDVADWAVAQGVAVRGRMCLMGGSYGGYAVLTGLVRASGRYACGVDYAGPVDLPTLMEAFPPDWKPFLPRSWYRFVGDPAKPADRARMRERSPLTHADRIVAPLLIFQGANDPRVTQAQSDSLVCALRRRQVPVRYLLAGNEGHSFTNEETGLGVNRATELFLAEHIGGRAQIAVGDATAKALADLAGAGDAVRCP